MQSNHFQRRFIMRTRFLTAWALAALLATGCSTMEPAAPAKVSDGVFVGSNGMTLYTFDRDAAGSGKSVCNGPCAQTGPP